MEDRIYHSLGQLLLNIAPPDAKKIIVEAELTEENDHCRLLYDYITSEGEKHWFLPPSADRNGNVKTRNYDAHHVVENKYAGRAEWWNITPAMRDVEHQGGIHRAQGPAETLFGR